MSNETNATAGNNAQAAEPRAHRLGRDILGFIVDQDLPEDFFGADTALAGTLNAFMLLNRATFGEEAGPFMAVASARRWADLMEVESVALVLTEARGETGAA